MKHPRRWQRLPLSRREKLPAKSGIYAVLNWHGKIFYLGRSINLRSRWIGKGHHRYPQARKLIGAQLAYIECNNIENVEAELIQLYNPEWNYTAVPSGMSIQPFIFVSATAIALMAWQEYDMSTHAKIVWQGRQEIIERLTQPLQ